jgi:hypothetical protein
MNPAVEAARRAIAENADCSQPARDCGAGGPGVGRCGCRETAEAVLRLTGSGRLDPVVEAVRADLHRRSQLGITKYGTTLGENPDGLRERLQHAYEECLDMANYLKWAMMELEARALERPAPADPQAPAAEGGA